MFTILFTFAFVFTRSFCSHFNIYALFSLTLPFPLSQQLNIFPNVYFPVLIPLPFVCPPSPLPRLSLSPPLSSSPSARLFVVDG